MIYKAFISFILILSSLPIFGQSSIEDKNRIVYNRIEYFFNTQQTDSIYALATEDFQKQVSSSDFGLIIQYFYQFGKIKEAIPVSANNNIIGYNIVFPNKTSYLQLAVNDDFKYYGFTIKDEPYIAVEAKDIKSNVTTTTTLDFFVDSIAKTYLSNPNTASLSIGIIHNNKINTFFYGESIKGDKASLPTGSSIYEVGSISKLFTSILLADLVEKNIISLDDSIAKYLPDSVKTNPYIQKITFKQLANHTSGLARIPSNLDKALKYDAKNPYANYTRKELYHYLKSVQQTTEPGEMYEYSNLGFGLLGDIISTITRKSFDQNIKETISMPLGMTNTVEKLDPKTQKMVGVYNTDGTATLAWDFQALAGAGALKSTTNDLLRFAQYQFKMPESNLENALALTRQFTYYLPPNTDIGLAWNMNMSNDVITYWHNGGTGGSSSFIAIVPDLKSAIVVLSNSANSVDDISIKILEKLLNTK
ncbi:serine hydrolase domain-containing protein [Sphingobacterium rhinopitheci]|uniref:serine hydrolase domain-containing protein n=1 Tax=Sphingobacterium rhinopitheci TaxID=2781960 RepID=UPI001F51C869|nr:serine hydrolase domain-containing protein [Sphingobacterium rhinopitheci]MCI0919912.1 beta-lactamase family protein [Sphingobacterium rhinopitheci]